MDFTKNQTNGINNYQFILNDNKPVLILSHIFATDITYWNQNIAQLRQHYSLLLYDIKGHGKSKVTEGAYTGEILGNDVINLLDHLKIKEAYYCGVSISGYLGEWLAINKPDRIKKVVIVCAGSSNQSSENQAAFKGLIEGIEKGGPSAVADPLTDVYLTKDFQQSQPSIFNQIKALIEKSDKNGLISSLHYLLEVNYDLSKLNIPTLVIGATKDPLVTTEIATLVHKNIKNSQLVILEGAHAINVEKPDEFNKAVIDFLG